MGKPEKGEGILIAVLDTGYVDHPWINDTIGPYEYNWMNGDRNDATDPWDDAGCTLGPLCSPGHGTSAIGVAAGLHGAAPNAKVLPFRMTNSVVAYNLVKLQFSIDFAREQGAHVVSMSL